MTRVKRLGQRCWRDSFKVGHFHQLTLLIAAIVLIVGLPSPAHAQRHRWHNDDFAYRRTVDLPTGMQTQPQIVVAEFFTHASWDRAANPDGAIVYTVDPEPVASRVLQLGPGDFARVAFQPVKEKSRYYVYYGGRQTQAIEVPRCGRRPAGC
jgi:hypothetical protein